MLASDVSYVDVRKRVDNDERRKRELQYTGPEGAKPLNLRTFTVCRRATSHRAIANHKEKRHAKRKHR